MRKYRAGIIGIGFIGAVHIEALKRLGNVEIAAIADPQDGQRKADSFGISKAYPDYKTMIDCEQLDVVHICTPNFTHYDIAMYAMDRDINVVCEKPMCCTADEANEMIARAKEKNLINNVNYHNRWYPMTAQLKEMVKKGEFGEIHAVYGEFSQDWLLYDTDYNWRVEASAAGKTRAVSDIGAHWLDLVEYITGFSIEEVCADFKILHNIRKKPKAVIQSFKSSNDGDSYEEVRVSTEDHANILFRLSNGAAGSAVFSQIIPGKKADLTLKIAGIEQSAVWSSDTSNEIWLGRRGGYNCIFEKDPGLLDEKVRINANYPGGHAEGFAEAFKNGFRAVYADIGTSNDNPSYATFETGLHEVVLCDRILESAQKRQWIKI